MADVWYGISKGDESPPAASVAMGCEARPPRRRRIEIRLFGMSPEMDPMTVKGDYKRKRQEASSSTRAFSRSSSEDTEEGGVVGTETATDESDRSSESSVIGLISSVVKVTETEERPPRYGVASVCGRRRDMEDAVTIYPSFCSEFSQSRWQYFGVYDGHGCSHVAKRCGERLHELVEEEVREEEEKGKEWNRTMERSFTRMDKEVVSWKGTVRGTNCRCDFRRSDNDAVGSTAVVSVITPEKIIVANCGDSRAVLCRKGEPIPLSADHKPDRPDELDRIQAAGGRVIYWDGPRVLGVLAMSRAIGDNYLKPYVSCEPEVTITDRTEEDECLILASDGLWDVVSNETACAVVRMCLHRKGRRGRRRAEEEGKVERTRRTGKERNGSEVSDQACRAASVLLTKLALARNSSDNVSVVVIDLRKGTR